MRKISRADAFGFSIIMFLFVLMVVIVFAIMDNSHPQKFSQAMIIQPDNTLVIGNLEAYDTRFDGKMYELKMSNGKTYLVPYTRITLIITALWKTKARSRMRPVTQTPISIISDC